MNDLILWISVVVGIATTVVFFFMAINIADIKDAIVFLKMQKVDELQNDKSLKKVQCPRCNTIFSIKELGFGTCIHCNKNTVFVEKDILK